MIIAEHILQDVGWYLLTVRADGTTSLDGSHATKRGAEQALKIIKGIGLRKGDERHFALFIGPIEAKGKVNSSAIKHCRDMVERAKRSQPHAD